MDIGVQGVIRIDKFPRKIIRLQNLKKTIIIKFQLKESKSRYYSLIQRLKILSKNITIEENILILDSICSRVFATMTFYFSFARGPIKGKIWKSKRKIKRKPNKAYKKQNKKQYSVSSISRPCVNDLILVEDMLLATRKWVIVFFPMSTNSTFNPLLSDFLVMFYLFRISPNCIHIINRLLFPFKTPIVLDILCLDDMFIDICALSLQACASIISVCFHKQSSLNIFTVSF